MASEYASFLENVVFPWKTTHPVLFLFPSGLRPSARVWEEEGEEEEEESEVGVARGISYPHMLPHAPCLGRARRPLFLPGDRFTLGKH